MKPHIREIDHVVLRVTDLDAMTRFYCDALGCHVEKVQQDLGLVQLRAGKSLIDLLARGTPEQSHNMDHLCLRVEPFDAAALRAHLAAHGARPGDAERRYGADGYGPSIYLYDPEGNMVELKGPPQAAAH
ncbi:lactoylglutathione lyase [Burkholderia singularis]|uniref:Lactoylglutathione lyase n=1 Tax=Burkholderia singularis TaxID=1503053 RepID=A0A118DNL7_9BURK|nr:MULTISPECIES: VOC family protein [Burkholderia]AOK28248.1 lactoylglutathione lyase [Burkholderia sp. Bp7605]KVE26676.1 lactoylglutathione lyase [Burkholderia singularis]